MQKIINYIGNNSSAVIAIAIVMFVIISAILLIVVIASNSGAKKQTTLLAKATQYAYRPKVIAKFITLDDKVRCLAFINEGTQFAKNVHISINDEWIDAKERLPDFKSNNEILRQLGGKKLVIPAGDRLVYNLYVIGAANVDLFKCQPLNVTIRYTDSSGKIRYEEIFTLDLSVFDDLATTGSDFDRGITRLGEKLERLENVLKDIDYRISEASTVARRMTESNLRARGDVYYEYDEELRRKRK